MNPPRFYWDTSVFLSFVNSASEPDRHAICSHLLNKAKNGEIVICTSTFTIVEVIRPKGVQASALSVQEIGRLESMFQWPWIKKYQVDELMGLKAARLSRQTNLKPADSIHVATAIDCGAQVLHAWDRDFSRAGGLIAVARPTYLNVPPLLARLDDDEKEETE